MFKNSLPFCQCAINGYNKRKCYQLNLNSSISIFTYHTCRWKIVQTAQRRRQQLHTVAYTTDLYYYMLWRSLQSPFYSVLFFSRPRSEGWPKHGLTFSMYLCLLSFWLTLPINQSINHFICLNKNKNKTSRTQRLRQHW